jgi:protein TonB
VLASARPAQANELQAPVPMPAAETKPVAATAPATPAMATAATPTAQATEAVRPPAQPVALPFSSVRYLTEPSRYYPPVSRELGESGVVKVKVLIDEQGRPNGNVTVVQSSGFRRLDMQAVRAMKAALFQPSIVDGVPRSAWVIAPFVFDLEEQ